MHRILALLTLVGAATAVAGTLAVSQPNMFAHHGAASARVPASSVCPDPAHCPFGSCAVSTKSSERGSCATPQACAQACPRGDAAASASVARK